jgi:VIT1/CCC1 family predicted Fe2+/Mn2+ transporter
MINYLIAIGVVFGLVILVAFTLVLSYFSYLVGLGLVLIFLVFIIKTLISDIDKGSKFKLN